MAIGDLAWRWVRPLFSINAQNKIRIVSFGFDRALLYSYYHYILFVYLNIINWIKFNGAVRLRASLVTYHVKADVQRRYKIINIIYFRPFRRTLVRFSEGSGRVVYNILLCRDPIGTLNEEMVGKGWRWRSGGLRGELGVQTMTNGLPRLPLTPRIWIGKQFYGGGGSGENWWQDWIHGSGRGIRGWHSLLHNTGFA